MHTLVIMQNDKKIKQLLPREGRVQFGIPGQPGTYNLQTFVAGTPATVAALGGLAGTLGTSYLDSANRIRRTIIDFAEFLTNPPITADIVEFQIIFIFHQTSQGTARDITRALTQLDGDAKWRDLPDRKHVGVRVPNCWLLSCESGTDQAVADNPNLAPALAQALKQWVAQARSMRLAAAAGLTTEQKPPPANPKQYWTPFIYTFSSGDPVTGGTTLNPQKVSFRTLPYTILPDGHFEKIPKPAGSTQTDDEYENGTPTNGKVYKYEGTRKVDERIIPAGAEANILAGGF